MLVVLPVGPQDREQAIRWLNWVEELGGIGSHRLIVACARRVPNPTELSRSYGLYVPHDEDERGWPMSPNHLFKRVAQHITWSPNPEAYFWCEPDCIPLSPDWIDRLESEYRSSGQYFMGANVKVDNTPEHMSGNAIYPKNVMERAFNIVHADLAAFDVVAAEQIVGQAHWTNLIQHVWKKEEGRNFTFPDQASVDAMVSKDAVVFHQNKDGTLIERLRERLVVEKPDNKELPKEKAKRTPKKKEQGKLTVVYKTYANDLVWLKYSLISLEKQFKHPFKLLIYCHDKAVNQLEKLLDEVDVFAKVIPVTYDINGYLKQMVVKCMCWQDVDTEYVAIMDSDVVFKAPVYFKDFFRGTKMTWNYLARTKQNETEEVWGVWKDAVHRMTGKNMDTYYMYNAFPFAFKTASLKGAYDFFIKLHGVDYNEFCRKGLDEAKVLPTDPVSGPDGKFPAMSKIFEEFEYLGWYFQNNTKDYLFFEGPNRNSMETRVQYWSHGGIDSKKEEIEKIVNT